MDDKNIQNLYTSFKDDSRGWLGLYRQHFTQFVAIILAVLAGSLTALHNLRGETWLLLLVSLGPAFNIALSILAMHSCNKYYLRYWEHEIASYKLYGILGIAEEINTRIANDKSLFPLDKHLFPTRWIERASKYKTSDEFAKARMKARDSSNWSIRFTFIVLAIISAIVGMAMLAKACINWFSFQP